MNAMISYRLLDCGLEIWFQCGEQPREALMVALVRTLRRFSSHLRKVGVPREAKLALDLEV